MLFAEIDNGIWSFVVLKETPRFPTSYDIGSTTRIQRFKNLPRMYGEINFEEVVVMGHRILGFLDIQAEALVEDKVGSLAGMSMRSLLLDYGNKFNADKLKDSFNQYLQSNVLIERFSRRRKVLPIVVWTYEGEFLLMYIEDGFLQMELLQETCFICNCHISLLKDVKINAIQAAEKKVMELREHIDKLDSHSIDSGHLLATSPLLSFVRTR